MHPAAAAFTRHNRQSSEGRIKMNTAPDISNVTDDPIEVAYPSDHDDIPSEQDLCASPHIQSISPKPAKTYKSIHTFPTPKLSILPQAKEVEETQSDTDQTPLGHCPADYDSDNYDDSDFEVLYDADMSPTDFDAKYSEFNKETRKFNKTQRFKHDMKHSINNQGERVDNLYIVDMLNRQNQENNKQIANKFEQFDQNYAIKLSSFQGQIDGIDQKMDGFANNMNHKMSQIDGINQKMDAIANTMNQKMEQLSISVNRRNHMLIWMLFVILCCCLFIGCFFFYGQYKDDRMIDVTLMQHSQCNEAMQYQSDALLSVIQEIKENKSMIKGLNASWNVAHIASEKQIADNIDNIRSEISRHQNENIQQFDELHTMYEDMIEGMDNLCFLIVFCITISIFHCVSNCQLFSTSNVSKPIQTQQPTATYTHAPFTSYTSYPSQPQHRRFSFSEIYDTSNEHNLDLHHLNERIIDDVQSSPEIEYLPLCPLRSPSDSCSSLSSASSLSSFSLLSSSSSSLSTPITVALNGPIQSKKKRFCYNAAKASLIPYKSDKVKKVTDQTESQNSHNRPSSNQSGSQQSGSQQGGDGGSDPPNDGNNSNSRGFNGGNSGNRDNGDDRNNRKNNNNRKQSSDKSKKGKSKRQKKQNNNEEEEEEVETQNKVTDQGLSRITMKKSKSAPTASTMKLKSKSTPKQSSLRPTARIFSPIQSRSSTKTPSPLNIPRTISETPDGSDLDMDTPLIPTPETPLFYGSVAPTDENMTDNGDKSVATPDSPPSTILDTVLTPQFVELQVVDGDTPKPTKGGKKKKSKKNKKKKKKQRKIANAKVTTGYTASSDVRAEGNIERPPEFIKCIQEHVLQSFFDRNHVLDSYTAIANIEEERTSSEYLLDDGDTKMCNFGFNDKQSNEKLLILAKKSSKHGYQWKFDRLMTMGAICDEYEKKEQDLPPSVPDILRKRFQNKVLHEVKIKEAIMDENKFNELITSKSTKFHEDDIVRTYYKEDKNRSVDLLMSKERIIAELKDHDKTHIHLVPIPIFNGKTYWLEHVWIVKIDKHKSNTSIGISFKYDERTENVILTGIHCNKQQLLRQHELVSFVDDEQKCDCLDTFESNIDRLKIYCNPDDKYYKPRCKIYEQYIRSVVDADAKDFEILCENARQVLKKPFHSQFSKQHQVMLSH